MTPRNVSEIVGSLTRYEIVATDGTDSMRLAFSARHTKSSLLGNLRSHAAEIVERFALGSDAIISAYRKADGWIVTGNGKSAYVRFSGRTERECYWSERN